MYYKFLCYWQILGNKAFRTQTIHLDLEGVNACKCTGMQLPDKLSDGTESVSQSLNRHFFLIKLQVVGITLTDTGVKKKKHKTKQILHNSTNNIHDTVLAITDCMLIPGANETPMSSD